LTAYDLRLLEGWKTTAYVLDSVGGKGSQRSYMYVWYKIYSNIGTLAGKLDMNVFISQSQQISHIMFVVTGRHTVSVFGIHTCHGFSLLYYSKMTCACCMLTRIFLNNMFYINYRTLFPVVDATMAFVYVDPLAQLRGAWCGSDWLKSNAEDEKILSIDELLLIF